MNKDIIEEILLFLDLKNIFKCKLVCKMFDNVITGHRFTSRLFNNVAKKELKNVYKKLHVQKTFIESTIENDIAYIMIKKPQNPYIRKIDFHLYTDDTIKYIKNFIYNNYSNTTYRMTMFYIAAFKSTKQVKYFKEIFRYTRMYSLNHEYTEFICCYYSLKEVFNNNIKEFSTFVEKNHINIQHLKSFADYIYIENSWGRCTFWKDFKDMYSEYSL